MANFVLAQYLKVASWLNSDEEGQGLVEYALILALIAVVVVVAVSQIGTNANTTFGGIRDCLGDAGACPGAAPAGG